MIDDRAGVQRPVVAVLAAAAVMIVVQLVVRARVAADGFFYWDDLILIARGSAVSPLSTDLWLYDHDGHLMPGAFLLAQAATAIAPWQWAPAAAMLVVLQLIASSAVLAALLTILGPRPAMLVPLGFYLFTPLTLPSFAWWANGLNQLPLQAGIAATVAAAIWLVRTGWVRYAAAGTVAFAAALLMTEKAIVIVVVAPAAAMLLARARDIDRPIRTVWRAGTALWWPMAVVAAGWAVAYATAIGAPIAGSGPVRIGPLLHHGVSLGLIPTLVGGPLSWQRWSPSPPWADPPTWLVIVAWLVVAAVVAASVVCRRRVGAVWPAVGVYVAVSAIAMILGRSGEHTADELAQTLRYFADTAVIVALAGAIVLAARPRRSPSRRAALLGAAATVTAAGLFLSAAAVSTLDFSRHWRDGPTASYVLAVRDSLAAADREVPLLDQQVPLAVLLPVAYPYNGTAALFSALDERPPFAASTHRLQVFDEFGRLGPGEFIPLRHSAPAPDGVCARPVTGPDVVLDPGRVAVVEWTEPVIGWEWTVQLHYLAETDGEITVALEIDSEPVTVPVHAGLHTVYVRIHGGGGAVTVAAQSPGVNMCLGDLALGGVTEAAG